VQIRHFFANRHNLTEKADGTLQERNIEPFALRSLVVKAASNFSQQRFHLERFAYQFTTAVLGLTSENLRKT
jgi:hypothetical protein